MAITVETFEPGTITEYVAKWKWLLAGVLIIGACADGMVALSQWYYLRCKRSLVFEHTAQTLSKLMFWSIQTGLLTSFVAVAILICFFVMSHNFIWLALFMFIAELYSNALLASLNARKNLRITTVVNIIDPVSPVSQRPSMNHSAGELQFSNRPAVEMTAVFESASQLKSNGYVDKLYLCQKQDVGLGSTVEV